MTPQEKANELYKKMFDSIIHRELTYLEMKTYAQACALISVDEIMHYSKAHGFIGLTEYYQEVKEEINKL